MADVDRITGSGVMRREWRELARFVMESFVAGLVVSLVMALAVFIVTAPAHAATVRAAAAAAATGATAAADAGTGALYLKDASGARTATPLLFTDVAMDVSGIIARVKVAQRFVNPTSEWREGVYVFPLPEKAAVDHLRMQVGERVIEGMIKERGEARRTYETAKSEGRKTSLVEQERPNMFTTSVANIGPGEEVVVTIEYQETLRYDDGTFRLRFPLAITPRYIPGTPVESAGGGLGWSPATQQVLDADRITPPVADRHEGYVNPVKIAIDLRAGFPLAQLASTYHRVDVEEAPGHRYRLTLADGPIPAARDFELAWTPDVGAAPGAALFTETKGGKTYALLMALPPSSASTPAAREPREITYIVDTSGSMEGVSIVQARDALLMALDRLQPGDRFNVIEFNSVAVALFPAPVPLDTATLARAKQFVSGLRARGGTEMLPALALALAGPREAAMIRQVVFLTDGAVGNEDAILRLVHDEIGDRRLFTVGIGPAPNAFFMTKAAQFGRGTYTFIGDVREVKEKMTALFRKLENPALTDIAVDWPAGADAWPRVLPDLYAGEPVVVTAQFNANAGGGNIAVSGRRGGALWGSLLPVADDGERAGRRRAVGAREDRRADGRRPQGRAGRGHPHGGPRRRAHASPGQQVHESGRRRRDADQARRGRGVQNRDSRQHSRGAHRLRPASAHRHACAAADRRRRAGVARRRCACAVAARGCAGAWQRVALAALAVAARSAPMSADAAPPAKSPPRNLLLLPGHYDGAIGAFDAPLSEMPDTGWYVLVKDAAGSYVRRIPEARGARPLFLRELELATPENSATLQSALGQLFYVNLPRTALCRGAGDGGDAAPPRAVARVRPRVCARARRHAVHADGEQRHEGPRRRALRARRQGREVRIPARRLRLGQRDPVRGRPRPRRQAGPDRLRERQQHRHLVPAAVEPRETRDERAGGAAVVRGLLHGAGAVGAGTAGRYDAIDARAPTSAHARNADEHRCRSGRTFRPEHGHGTQLDAGGRPRDRVSIPFGRVFPDRRAVR